ncbi:hypothetical protein MP228_003372 [Amoeboaphelidium protococcarum]|nr:hypothetical protein MP228_003372 [Amoeboaphelidium protococcarum]
MNVDLLLDNLKNKQKLPTENMVRKICERMKEILIDEPNVMHISTPVSVVGDVHGQFHDVLEIFRIGGECPDTNYLFLGDYVDRGYYSVETMLLLCLLKIKYPQRINLLRGNHESRAVTQVYGFYLECQRKYGSSNVWNYFTDMFDYLTLSVMIDNSIFCLHGGLSPCIHSIDQIRVLDRFKEIPHEGAIADIMWSDPENDKDDFQMSPRGAGYTFGAEVVKHFSYVNDVSHILRAHQLCMEGYQVLFENRLSTVWSAPNYCYRCGNDASILEIWGVNPQQRRFNVFSAAPENERDTAAGNATADGQVGRRQAENQYFL